MAKDIQPGGFTLKFKDGQLSLHANSAGPTGNKKVPPGTLLQLIRAGAMKKEEVVGSEPYTLDPKKMVMIAGAQTGPDKLLIKGIDQAPDFVAPGQCPAKIIVGGPYWFVTQQLVITWRNCFQISVVKFLDVQIGLTASLLSLPTPAIRHNNNCIR